jgi:hypothetical protein
LNRAWAARFEAHSLQSRAYHFEFGTLPQQLGPKEWQQILLAAAFATSPFVVAIVTSIATYFVVNQIACHQPKSQVIWIVQYQDKIVG